MYVCMYIVHICFMYIFECKCCTFFERLFSGPEMNAFSEESSMHLFFGMHVFVFACVYTLCTFFCMLKEQLN